MQIIDDTSRSPAEIHQTFAIETLADLRALVVFLEEKGTVPSLLYDDARDPEEPSWRALRVNVWIPNTDRSAALCLFQGGDVRMG